MSAVIVPAKPHERERYRRQCAGKIRYDDPMAAALAAWRAEQRNQWPYHVYACEFCGGGLHVGGKDVREKEE